MKRFWLVLIAACAALLLVAADIQCLPPDDPQHDAGQCTLNVWNPSRYPVNKIQFVSQVVCTPDLPPGSSIFLQNLTERWNDAGNHLEAMSGGDKHCSSYSYPLHSCKLVLYMGQTCGAKWYSSFVQRNYFKKAGQPRTYFRTLRNSARYARSCSPQEEAETAVPGWGGWLPITANYPNDIADDSWPDAPQQDAAWEADQTGVDLG